MGNLSDFVINVGDTIYVPVIDSVGIGFLIEEVVVCRLWTDSKHPSGTFKVVWSYGNTSFYKEQEAKRERKYKTYSKKNCYYSIADCIEYIEEARKRLLESQKGQREQVLAEVVELKKMLEEAKKESVTVSRAANKNIAMLNQFDVRRDLEKRGLV